MVALSKAGAYSDVVNVKSPTYGAVGNGVAVSATISITSAASALTATGAAFTVADIGKMISVPGAGAAGIPLVTTIATFTDATHVGLTATASTTVSAVAGIIAYGTDDTTAIQNAITAAQTAGKPLYIPNGLYATSAALSVTANLEILGESVTPKYNNNINMPTAVPALSGAVIFPASNGSNGITLSGSSLIVNISRLGVLFQTPFVNTGHGISYPPTATQGLCGSLWERVMVYGHSGNNYAFNLKNFIYNTFDSLFCWGGGGFDLFGNGATGNYGNSTFIAPQIQVVAGGAAHGIRANATSTNNLNLLLFIAPQVGLVNEVGVTPSGNAPTGAQLAFTQDANVTNVKLVQEDFGGNIAGMTVLLYPGHQNSYDFLGGYYNVSVTSPAWTTSGILISGNPVTLTDTTSTGTVAVGASCALPASVIKASSATTFTNYATLYLPAPSASTNVSIGSPLVLYGAGSATITGALTVSTGIFVVGSSQINASTSGSTQIGNANGAVGIGKAAASTSNLSIAGSTTAKSLMNLATGSAPTTPVDGDLWREDNTNTGLKVRINGVTKTITVS